MTTISADKMDQLSFQISGEPIGWKKWYSVQNAPFPILKVCPQLCEDVYIYSNANDLYGLLDENRIITKPLFAMDFHVVADEYAVAAQAIVGSNNLALVNMRSGKIPFKGFSAYIMLDDSKLAYRIDGDCRQWPNNMRWGVLSLPSCEKILAPKSFPLLKKENYIPLEDRIMESLAKK